MFDLLDHNIYIKMLILVGFIRIFSWRSDILYNSYDLKVFLHANRLSLVVLKLIIQQIILGIMIDWLTFNLSFVVLFSAIYFADTVLLFMTVQRLDYQIISLAQIRFFGYATLILRTILWLLPSGMMLRYFNYTLYPFILSPFILGNYYIAYYFSAEKNYPVEVHDLINYSELFFGLILGVIFYLSMVLL